MRDKSHPKATVTRFAISIIILLIAVVFLTVSDSSSSAAWFVLLLGSVPVLLSVFKVYKQVKTRQ